jgi:hypothetical protein
MFTTRSPSTKSSLRVSRDTENTEVFSQIGMVVFARNIIGSRESKKQMNLFFLFRTPIAHNANALGTLAFVRGILSEHAF